MGRLINVELMCLDQRHIELGSQERIQRRKPRIDVDKVLDQHTLLQAIVIRSPMLDERLPILHDLRSSRVRRAASEACVPNTGALPAKHYAGPAIPN